MTAATRITLQQHPLSAAFPSMAEDDLAALAEDIRKHGQREPGVLYEGKVLDGWHRYLASQQAGAKFKSVAFDGDDPVAFVLSKNLLRRHLTVSQRAGCVVAAHNWKKPGRPGNSAAAAEFSTKQLADRAEVSERTIIHAKAAERAGLGEAVRNGEVSAERAAEIAKLPKAKRAKALKEPGAPKQPKQTGDVAKVRAELIDLQGKYADLLEQNVDLKNSLAEMTDLAASAKAFEEKDEFKEMQVLRVELRSCKRRRDELMAENAEMKKQIAYWKKKAEGKKK